MYGCTVCTSSVRACVPENYRFDLFFGIAIGLRMHQMLAPSRCQLIDDNTVGQLTTTATRSFVHQVLLFLLNCCVCLLSLIHI